MTFLKNITNTPSNNPIPTYIHNTKLGNKGWKKPCKMKPEVPPITIGKDTFLWLSPKMAKYTPTRNSITPVNHLLIGR